MRVILRILRLVFSKYKILLFAGYVSAFGAAFAALAIPRVLGTSVDRVLSSGAASVSELYSLALILLLAGIARGFFSLGQTYLAETISQKFAYDIRNAYFNKLQHLSFGFHDKQMTGALMSRATADVEGVRMFINMGAVRATFVIATIVGIAIAMLMVDVRLALLSLSFVPVLGFLSVTTSMTLRKIWLTVQELTADLVTVLQENLSGARVVKAFAAEQHEIKKFESASHDVASETYRAQKRWAKNFSNMNFAFTAAIAMIIWVGGPDVIAGRTIVDGEAIYSGLTPGELTSFIFYMTLLTMPVRMMGWMVNTFSRAASCGERIFEILDTPSPVDDLPTAKPLENARGHVVFKDVEMRYDEASPVLQNINVEALPGQTIAMLGRPGSGKSTFSHLIPRFYDVTSGQILIDDVDIRQTTLASLRDNVGIVQQDVFIHTASIRDNIAYGNADAPLEKIIEVAKLAQLHLFITSLPDGYDTVVGERGIGLSGGQKQRLSIARTLLRNPPILILDDSTSSVDAHTENLLQAGLDQVAQNRTTFVITSRQSTIRNADTILVFKNGNIVERGTHTELLALNGEYNELHEVQLRPEEQSNVSEINPMQNSGKEGGD